ncbi:unnamed protein product [Blepharisma stoltei]|uniref:FYVE-type domain-containing protein n=1 Tax=Blepharisma stoltei TaxID=1481888 RepID=A0AAU9JN53_9CILI|nr:unnamed protein product [Blepharisma stoltei]
MSHRSNPSQLSTNDESKGNELDRFSANQSLASSTSSIFTRSPFGKTGEGDHDWKLDNKCFICDRKFNLTIRRHHCRFCGNSVCDDHSMKRRQYENLPKKQRICDNCNRELIREEIKKEIEEEIAKLQSEVQHQKEMNERLLKEHTEKTQKISQLESDLTKAERIQREKEQSMQEKLNEVLERGEKSKNLVEDLRKSLDVSHNNEQEISNQVHEGEKQLEKYRIESENLRDRKEELASQIEHLTNRIKSSLPLSEVREAMCNRCKTRLDQTYKPFAMDGTIIEEENETSVLSSSVRGSINVLKRS